MSTAYYGRAVPLALRRFARLKCIPHAKPNHQIVLPGDLPSGVHVVLLINRLRQIEHADSWLGVREAWDRLLAENGIRQQGEMQMYICCMLPSFWPQRWWWKWRIRGWANLVQKDYPDVHLLAAPQNVQFYSDMCIHNDRRAYAMVIRNDGEILWGSHDKFEEKLQERQMVQIVREEVDWRIDEADRLLEGGPKLALGSDANIEAAETGTPGEAEPVSHVTRSHDGDSGDDDGDSGDDDQRR